MDIKNAIKVKDLVEKKLSLEKSIDVLRKSKSRKDTFLDIEISQWTHKSSEYTRCIGISGETSILDTKIIVEMILEYAKEELVKVNKEIEAL